jgi:hypothetical protein
MMGALYWILFAIAVGVWTVATVSWFRAQSSSAAEQDAPLTIPQAWMPDWEGEFRSAPPVSMTPLLCGHATYDRPVVYFPPDRVDLYVCPEGCGTQEPGW